MGTDLEIRTKQVIAYAINVDIQQPSEQLTTEKINEQQITEDIVDNRPQEHEEGACTNHAEFEAAASDHELVFVESNNDITCQTDLVMENIDGIEEDDKNLRAELL